MANRLANEILRREDAGGESCLLTSVLKRREVASASG
jgi:hypothetical protein